MKRYFLNANHIRLHVTDFGGEGPNVLLLHGLMGRGSNWTSTAMWLRDQGYRVVALDQRGHGHSDKPDDAYTRDHYVGDAIAVIEQLELAPAIVIGHSMGALNAWVLAARRPDLIASLVLEDTNYETVRPEEETDPYVNYFASWPVPFPTLQAVRDFFGARRASYADYFMEIMTETADGYRPLFSFEHMLQSTSDWRRHSFAAELEQIQCPTLVLRACEGTISQVELQRMATLIPQGRYLEIEQAGHVIHYDQPQLWRQAVLHFLKEV
ncbi:MAG: alpha/beta fold hydrolase [Tumebacillaceae bacterium]